MRPGIIRRPVVRIYPMLLKHRQSVRLAAFLLQAQDWSSHLPRPQVLGYPEVVPSNRTSFTKSAANQYDWRRLFTVSGLKPRTCRLRAHILFRYVYDLANR